MVHIDNTQVLVVGGGPAGVISALTAAKFGIKVILIDTKAFEDIGKKTCGDGLIRSSTTFLKDKLGIKEPQGNEVADTFQNMNLRASNVDLALTGEGYILNRLIYGQRLLKIAMNYGVEVRANTKAIRVITESNIVKGAVVQEKGKELYHILSKITIDCSGRNFQIRRTLPRDDFPNLEKRMEKRDIAASYREILRLKNQDHPYHNSIYLEYRKSIPGGGYFWIFSKGEHKLNVGIGHSLDTKIEWGMKNHFREILHEYYPPSSYIVEEKGGYTIPTRYPLTNAVASGFLTAGDAAFHANPFSSEGHAPALVAGYYAGKVASKSIKVNDTSQNQLWEYNIDIMKHFGLTHTKYQLIAAALRRIKVKGLEFLFRRSILTQKHFTDLLSDQRDLGIFTIMKVIIKSFPRYNILLQLSKTLKEVDFFKKMFEEYPNSPNDYPDWNVRFKTKINRIRRI